MLFAAAFGKASTYRELGGVTRSGVSDLLEWGVRFLSFLLVGLWVAADQGLKLYTVNNLPFNGPAETVVPGLLAFTHALNKGAAWSLFWGQLGPLTALRFSVGVVLLLVLLRPQVKGWTRFALTLIAGGAFGNAIDGFFREGVVDMLVLWPLTTVYRAVFGGPFPIFNIADVGVVGGAFIMIASSFFTKSPETPKEKEDGFEFVDTYEDPFAGLPAHPETPVTTASAQHAAPAAEKMVADTTAADARAVDSELDELVQIEDETRT